ncbi:MAG TPA: aminopeptidase, partial [Pseudomonas sp.]|nr:aminopeptidase [Pseudomonas sp.]
MKYSGPGPLDRLFRYLVPLSVAFLLSGCGTAGYYAQLTEGQWQLLRARQPVDQVLADPATSAQLRARLRHAEEARAFASEQLKLPDNRSYRLYADLKRPYVVWNV